MKSNKILIHSTIIFTFVERDRQSVNYLDIDVRVRLYSHSVFRCIFPSISYNIIACKPSSCLPVASYSPSVYQLAGPYPMWPRGANFH